MTEQQAIPGVEMIAELERLEGEAAAGRVTPGTMLLALQLARKFAERWTEARVRAAGLEQGQGILGQISNTTN